MARFIFHFQDDNAVDIRIPDDMYHTFIGYIKKRQWEFIDNIFETKKTYVNWDKFVLCREV